MTKGNILNIYTTFIYIIYFLNNRIDNFDQTQTPYYGFDGNKLTLFVKNVPKTVSR